MPPAAIDPAPDGKAQPNRHQDTKATELRRRRLDGLDYTMAKAALMPDDRLASWVLAMAAKR